MDVQCAPSVLTAFMQGTDLVLMNCRHVSLHDPSYCHPQAGACLHVVCEASFNLIRPDAQQWLRLGAQHVPTLSAAWDARLLYYADHVRSY
jgi:hypothetical protein